MPALEYKIYDTTKETRPTTLQGPDDYDRWLEGEFAKLSEEGWELVTAERHKFIFKRLRS